MLCFKKIKLIVGILFILGKIPKIGDRLCQSHFNKKQLKKEDSLQPNSNAIKVYKNKNKSEKNYL